VSGSTEAATFVDDVERCSTEGAGIVVKCFRCSRKSGRKLIEMG